MSNQRRKLAPKMYHNAATIDAAIAEARYTSDAVMRPGLVVFQSIPTTMDIVDAAINNDLAKPGFVAIALEQSQPVAGSTAHNHQRRWWSAENNLQFSIELARGLHQSGDDILSVATLAGCKCIDEFLGTAKAMRSGNNIYVDGRMVGGCLVYTNEKYPHLVNLGVGLNLNYAPPPSHLNNADNHVASLRQVGVPAISLGTLLEAYIYEFNTLHTACMLDQKLGAVLVEQKQFLPQRPKIRAGQGLSLSRQVSRDNPS